jgi:hypothetical protein
VGDDAARKRTLATLGAVALVLATFVAFVAGSAFSNPSAPHTAGSAPHASSPTTVPASKITASSTTNQTVGMPKSSLDLTELPLGSNRSTATPRKGYLYRCGGTPHGGPPVTIPPWVDTSAKTWSARSKLASGGKVTRTATFKATKSGANQLLKGNGLPARSGTFPVAASDPTHAYNPNPGTVTAHSISLSLPYNPKVNATPRCEAGAVGLAVNGIPLLDGFDAGGYDASAVEVQDTCHGHPNNLFGYHYHGLSPCLLSTNARTHATQVGWALDGFGIVVEDDAHGRLLTNASLDVCHGRTSTVPWHGKNVKIYHYVMTYEFPYTVGCYRGTPKSFAGMTISAHF